MATSPEYLRLATSSPRALADTALDSLRDAEILTRPSSLLYVQALKFLQTRATPASARRARKARRVKRVKEGHGGRDRG